MVPPTVLYVEDSATSQTLMRKYLDGRAELTISPSVKEGLGMLRERSFDLVIADFLFPDGDALELIRAVRSRFTPDQLPLLVVSSSLDAALLTKVIRAGANDGLQKPLKVAELREVVDRLLETRYVRTLENALSSVVTFQWSLDGVFYDFCPELGITLSGESRPALSARMAALIEAELAQGRRLARTQGERVFTHVVKG